MEEEKNPLELEFFKEHAFERKECISCGKPFWSRNAARITCGDPPCDQYTFIRNSPVKKKYALDEMREEFLKYFRDTHTLLHPYPVVPRWRDDVLLVNASIYDFQPHVTSGIVPAPANPIVMSQPSIRMVDVDLVGSTGRHLTTFEMMCHDSFNSRSKQVYWKEETVAYCDSFLTEQLGIDPLLITYTEKPWSGGGNGGSALEVMVCGLEVATLVFMDMEADPDGSTEIDGIMYSPMEMKIVDTGYGLERLTWLSQATPTIYEAIYPGVINHVLSNSDAQLIDHRLLEVIVQNFARNEGKTDSEIIRIAFPELAEIDENMTLEQFMDQFHTLRSAFIIADHARTLLLLFSDYVIPSNIKAGYLARLLIRRALRNMELIHYRGTMKELIAMHWESLKNIIKNYPEGFIDLMLEDESRKYSETLEKGRGMVERMLSRNGINQNDLITLYDSYGLHPDFVAAIVREKTGTDLEVPDDFHSRVISVHEGQGKTGKTRQKFPEISTRPLYYDDVSIYDFNALVLHSGEGYIIPNQTAFYPEGGGQPSDLGNFVYHNKKIELRKAEKHGDAIVHWIDGDIPKGARVMGHVDKFRRRRLMVHHSATHLILGVMKEILGPHVWQFGVQKGVETSRVDITHYRKLSQEDIEKIEKRCLELITEGRAIRVRNVDWNRAIEKYGFSVFQGGVPLSPKLRLVEIEGVDVEGCGGTHVSSTSELGFIKILSADSIQEGIQRITFAAGDAALEYLQGLYSSMKEVQSSLAADISEVAGRVKSTIMENIELKKEKDALLKKEVNSVLDSAVVSDYKWGKAVVIRSSLGAEGMKLLTKALFSRKYELSVIINSTNAGELDYTAIAKEGINGKHVLEELTGKPSSVKGNAAYSTAVSHEEFDERLIKYIFNSL